MMPPGPSLGLGGPLPHQPLGPQELEPTQKGLLAELPEDPAWIAEALRRLLPLSYPNPHKGPRAHGPLHSLDICASESEAIWV